VGTGSGIILEIFEPLRDVKSVNIAKKTAARRTAGLEHILLTSQLVKGWRVGRGKKEKLRLLQLKGTNEGDVPGCGGGAINP